MNRNTLRGKFMRADHRYGPAFMMALWCAAIFVGGTAWADLPASVYVVPTKVDFIPNQATATKVVIHGAFIVTTALDNPGRGGCGKMYFVCTPGSEAMCQRQWDAIDAGVGQPICQGFGTAHVVTTALLRAEGAALVNPDTWDLGTGIWPDDYVEKYCPGFALSADCVLASKHDLGVASQHDLGVAPMDMEVKRIIAPTSSGRSCSIGFGGRATTNATFIATATFVALTLLLRRRLRRRWRPVVLFPVEKLP